MRAWLILLSFNCVTPARLKINKNFSLSVQRSLMNTYEIFYKRFLKNELMAIYAHKNKELFYNNDIETILKNIVSNNFSNTLLQAYKPFCLVPPAPATTTSIERSFGGIELH